MHAMALQDELRRSWLEGAEGRLCGREQAKAWALREVWMDHGKSPYDVYTFIARSVRKARVGKAKGDRPTNTGIKEFFEKIDRHPEWSPGKHNGEKRGPNRSSSSSSA